MSSSSPAKVPEAAYVTQRGARPHNLALEGLRGLAAIMVVYCHNFAPLRAMDPGFAPSVRFSWFESGQGAVALFFIISGFVIGMTNRPQWSRASAKDYLWRRLVRLVPLCWIAIAVGEWVHPDDSLRAIVGNLLFLQNPDYAGKGHIPPLWANYNLWTLNFELLYYLLFLAVWRWQVPRGRVIWAALALAAVGYFRPNLVPPFVASYLVGWAFWLAGLWLAWDVAPQGDAAPREPWPALILLFVLQWRMRIGAAVLHGLQWDTRAQPATFSLANYDFLPICLVLVAVVTQRSSAPLRFFRNAVLGAFAAYWIYRLGRRDLGSLETDGVYLALSALAGALWWWRPSLRPLAAISLTGLLCYGIYIFSRPVEWLVRNHLPLPQGSAATFIGRQVVALALTFAAAWVAERILQPQIRRWLDRHVRPRLIPAPPVVAEAAL